MLMPSEAVLASIRTELLSERSALRQQLEELGVSDDDVPGLTYDSNFADTSQVTAERGENAALVASLSEHLASVDRALQKVDDGSYGVCEKCAQPIPEARLEAMPISRFCMNCASTR
jgi:DnaK suppressor protein